MRCGVMHSTGAKGTGLGRGVAAPSSWRTSSLGGIGRAALEAVGHMVLADRGRDGAGL